jgi:hypothetical protein
MDTDLHAKMCPGTSILKGMYEMGPPSSAQTSLLKEILKGTSIAHVEAEHSRQRVISDPIRFLVTLSLVREALPL